MADDKPWFSISISLNSAHTIWPRVANWTSDRNKIGVHNPKILGLEDSIKKFEHLPANKLVITVDNHVNLIRLTVLFGGLV